MKGNLFNGKPQPKQY